MEIAPTVPLEPKLCIPPGQRPAWASIVTVTRASKSVLRRLQEATSWARQGKAVATHLKRAWLHKFETAYSTPHTQVALHVLKSLPTNGDLDQLVDLT
jgi:hypothetical protein